MPAVEQVKATFERPEPYLVGSRHNICIRAETVQSFIAGRTFGRILDIGCGDGSISLPLLRSDNRITLLDLSGAMIDTAARKVPTGLKRNVEFVNADFETAYISRRFDLILCVGVFAHIDSPNVVVRKIASLLENDGSVIAQVTDCRHPISQFTRGWGKARSMVVPSPYEVTTLSATDVINMFSAAGCELVDEYRYSTNLPGAARVLSEKSLYKLTRFIHGYHPHGRNVRLGNEFLLHFRKTRTS